MTMESDMDVVVYLNNLPYQDLHRNYAIVKTYLVPLLKRELKKLHKRVRVIPIKSCITIKVGKDISCDLGITSSELDWTGSTQSKIGLFRLAYEKTEWSSDTESRSRSFDSMDAEARS